MEVKQIRNAEATKERILNAATAEFSAFGIAGARVDRIATAARCNKNLIYVYFQDKEHLFNTVLQTQLLRRYEEAPFTIDDLPGYAAKAFELSLAQPELMRLMAWSALERETASVAARRASSKRKIAVMAAAQKTGRVGDAFSPEFLQTAILSIAHAWSAASPYGATLDPNALKRPAALKKQVAEAVRLLTRAKRDLAGSPQKG